jgi:LPXTG-motif cell wall-anchored protein
MGGMTAGETYIVLIPKMFAERSTIPGLAPADGTTSIIENNEYWEVAYTPSKPYTAKFDIPLLRNTQVALSNIFANSDNQNFYRPYDLITGQIKVIHGTEVTKLPISYQLPNLFVGENGYLSIRDISNRVVGNGLDIDLSVPIGLGFMHQSSDIFGAVKITVPEFSFEIQGPAGKNISDWIQADSATGTITVQNQNGSIFRDNQGSFHLNLEPQGNNVIKVKITDITSLAINALNVTKNWVANIPLHIHLPQSAFKDASSEVPFNIPDVNIKNMTAGNVTFNSRDYGTDFKVIQAHDAFEEQIRYQEYKTYQNIDAVHYRTNEGGYQPDNQPISGELIDGQRYDSGYKVDGFTNVGNKDLQNIHYVLNIPDGISIYSVTYGGGNLKNVPDSMTLTLSNGTEIDLTKDQLQGKSLVSLRHNISANGYYIDSLASIRKVEAFYSTVLGHSVFGVTASHDKNGYRIESDYSDGRPVKNADRLYFNAKVSSEDPANKFTSPELSLCEVYIKDFAQGVTQEVAKDQTSGQAGDEVAGSMSYQISDSASNAYRPNLEHPVAYIKVPTNATISDLSQITVKSGANGVMLTPKSISAVKVGGANFVKVDLSNYDLLREGFTVTVLYGNAIDAVPGAEHSPFLVLADNLNGSVQNVHHFSSADATADADMKALIDQEGLDTAKTSYVGVSDSIGNPTPQWTIAQGMGLSSYTEVSDNQSVGVKTSGEQSINKENPDTFSIYGSISNSTSQTIHEAVEVVNLPDTADGYSQFTPVMTGPANLVVFGRNSGEVNKPTLLYRLNPMILSSAKTDFKPGDGSWLTASQVNDWSKVKSVAVSLLGKEIPPCTTLRLEIPVKDAQIYDHVNKTVYVASAIFSQGVEDDEGLKTLVIEPSSKDAGKLTVVGQSTIKNLVHYKDENGQDHYVELPGHTKTYQDGIDTMKRSDFLQSGADLTAADKALLPDGFTIYYAHPTIQNSDKTYLNNYPNHPAAFDQLVKYDFDGDAVVFEAKSNPSKPTDDDTTKTITRTIHYVYTDGTKAADDVVQTVTFTRDRGAWTPSDPQSFAAVTSPTIAGYTPNIAVVPGVEVHLGSSFRDITVIYIKNGNPSTPDNKPDNKPDDKPNIDDNHQDLPYKPHIDEDEHNEQEHKQQEQKKQQQKQQVIRRVQEKPVTGHVTETAAKLPQTGNKNENRSALATIFIGLAGLLSLFGFKKKRKN